MYTAEVTVDTAMGVCIAALWLGSFLIALAMEYAITSSLGPQGIFFILSLMTFIGAIFVATFVKETRGKSDIEKKQMYN